MIIVNVFVHVKPEYIEEFRIATLESARSSVKEPGITRFDVLQDISDQEKFQLVEVYRTQADSAKHKDTRHYKKWSQTVMSMMAEPRRSIRYANIYPDDEGW